MKPTPFQQRIAQQNGRALQAIPGTPLNGYLTRPPGEGPFPAVVVLHGCSGLFPTVEKTWSQRLSSWGYVVLVVDSFSTRGIRETCDHGLLADGSLFADRVYDAYGALEFLSKLSFVDPQRTALMGFSAGGIATLAAVQLGGAERLMDRKFKAAVAYYPNCSATNGDVAVPTLILIGELDDWTPAKNCREMMAQRSGKGSAVQLDVFKGARHAFASPSFKTGTEQYGHRVEYNAAAAEKSASDVHTFLKQAFSGQQP
ncbi:MAG: dienelactone hydrolase family protein [Mesorhizobium sp.]|nr:dienelactone hydrolase family protein [Mesorhizobium sp. M1A.T.Ca.IN.004.03.1.1]RWG16092.1 MAG: dienelactone hydrolase family protein [Mesorhizobium sp.]RWI92955.1 MAG: dienelactone hydrolase family protein [Mesorhizobium sp.]RWK35079.1 MAG: dienelactone hydrolase family protein [Mesorhizobium sp.]RWK85243.1 MAG: dienelactone hydrolase family protein [Mesorhizobium sp.]